MNPPHWYSLLDSLLWCRWPLASRFESQRPQSATLAEWCICASICAVLCPLGPWHLLPPPPCAGPQPMPCMSW